MSQIPETDDDGELTFPRDVLGSVSPVPWIESFHAWMSMPRPSSPVLPDEAFSRESIYDCGVRCEGSPLNRVADLGNASELSEDNDEE